MRDSLIKAKEKSETQLSKINTAILVIDNSLQVSISSQNNIEIILPEDLLNMDRENEKESQLRWREQILMLLSKADHFLSTSEIYNSLLPHFPLQLRDKRKSIKTISSSLVALTRDGKIGKVTGDSGQLVFGDSIKHFMPSGKPNKLYLEKKQLQK